MKIEVGTKVYCPVTIKTKKDCTWPIERKKIIMKDGVLKVSAVLKLISIGGHSSIQMAKKIANELALRNNGLIGDIIDPDEGEPVWKLINEGRLFKRVKETNEVQLEPE